VNFNGFDGVFLVKSTVTSLWIIVNIIRIARYLCGSWASCWHKAYGCRQQ